MRAGIFGLGSPSPSALAKDLRSPKLEGANGGEGRLPAPIGEGGTLDEVGDVVGKGREGRDGPPAEESGDG